MLILVLILVLIIVYLLYQKKLDEKLSKFKTKESEIEREKSSSSSVQIPEEAEQVDINLNKEIEKKLKSRGEPIRLFGENDRQRMTRLKLSESREEERSGGQRNDFYELLKEETGEEGNDSIKRIKTSDSSISSVDDIKESINRELLIKNRTKSIELIELYFCTLIKEWQTDLDSRPEDVKKTTSGRMSSATFQQTKDYLNPFFKLLKKDELPGDILSHVIDIIGFLQKREYVRANDTYLRLSIGNAPWPIGVTMVGIHERSAHEKINTGSVAHALNDEVTRKWIQSIKRLMTFCQKVHPPTDSSKAMG